MNTTEPPVISEGSNDTQLTTVAVEGLVAPISVGQDSGVNPSPLENPAPSDIANFLARPVNILNFLSSAADIYYAVWNLFLTNPAVVSKIANYKGIRGTLHVRITETTIPYAYGCVRYSYGPIIGAGAGAPYRVDNKYSRSCWPGLYTNPSGQSIYEFTLPYCGLLPYFNLAGGTTMDNGLLIMGIYRDTFNAYDRADTGGSVVLPVVFEAWMTDVELALQVPLNIHTQSKPFEGFDPKTKPFAGDILVDEDITLSPKEAAYYIAEVNVVYLATYVPKNEHFDLFFSILSGLFADVKIQDRCSDDKFDFVRLKKLYKDLISSDCGVDFSALIAEFNKQEYRITNNITFQSKSKKGASKEYQGSVSGPASMVAGVAKRLADVPFIGGFAKATEIGANAVSSIASLFGFSKPAYILEPQRVLEDKTFNMFTSEGLDYTNKLTSDPKQENTIAPLFGDTGEDPLSFGHICGKYGIVLANAVWQTTDNVGQIIFTLPVTPGIIYDWNSAKTLTPTAFVGSCFSMWRGSLIFRIRVIASSFHQGRLEIFYSPSILTAYTETMTNITSIALYDISENQDLEIEVPWSSLEPFKNFNLISANQSDATYNSNYSFLNGYLVFRVYAQLIAPSSAANAYINVEVKGGDDLAFARPSGAIFDALHANPLGGALGGICPFGTWAGNGSLGGGAGSVVNPTTGYPTDVTLQAGVFSGTSRQVKRITVPVSCIGKSENELNSCAGEAIVSFRQLAKGYFPYCRFVIDNGDAGDYGWCITNFPFIPQQFTVQLLSATYQFPPNGVCGNLLSWLHLAYFARRGGIRYKIFRQTAEQATTGGTVNTPVAPVMAFRCRADTIFQFNQAGSAGSTNFSNIMRWFNNGSALNVDRQSNMIAAELPYQTTRSYIPIYGRDFRYNLGVPSGSGIAIGLSADSLAVVFPVTGNFTGTPSDYCIGYVAAAEDFTLDFFLGPGVLNGYQMA